MRRRMFSFGVMVSLSNHRTDQAYSSTSSLRQAEIAMARLWLII